MPLLNYALMFLLLLSSAADERDLSLKVQSAVAPSRPIHTLATALVVAEIEINEATGAVQTRALYGEPPFVSSALDALRHWQFSMPPDASRARTSISFLFRSPAFYSAKLPAVAIRPWMADDDCPALPQKVTDPGYPVATLATGAVILEVRVDQNGNVTGVATIQGLDVLTGVSIPAVKNWKFSPAMISGKAVPSTTFVVISFVLPT